MKAKEYQNSLSEYNTTIDEDFEISCMLPQQIIRVLWDGFSDAVDCAEATKKYFDVCVAAQAYSNLIDATIDLSELQADFWIGRADDYLPDFWCVWMQWVGEKKALKTYH